MSEQLPEPELAQRNTMEVTHITEIVAIVIKIPAEEVSRLYWDINKVFTNGLPMSPVDAENRRMMVPVLRKFYDTLYKAGAPDML